ncbi:hypothetical protein C8F01DRAFT_1281336 [Mycena amicta]|nr:hypothetical protein C8F01DRAFT_1281336 [Mycena amicta]
MLRENWLAKPTDWLAKPTDRHDKPACLAWALMPTQNPSPSQKSQSAQGQASLASQKVNSPQEAYTRILYGCVGEKTFEDAEPTPAAVLLTPGLYILIAHLWRHILHFRSRNDTQESVALAISLLTAFAQAWDSVAQLMIIQLRWAFPSSQDPLTHRAALLLNGVNSLLALAYVDGESPLRETLFQLGLVRLLTNACLVLSKQLVPHDLPSLIEETLWFLANSFLHASPHTAMVSCLRAGLLPLIISCASGPYRNNKDVTRELESILRSIISLSCYASVLLQLKDSLSQLSTLGLDLAPALRHFGLEEKWNKFKQHPLEYRLGLVTPSSRKGMKDVEALRGCDNLKCASIMDKHAMKRCSKCLITHYCGQKCQKADWEDGHRERCKTIAARYLEYIRQTCAADRALHRTLIRLDYTFKRHLVLARLIECIRQNDTVALVRFSYIGGESQVTVMGSKELAALERESPKALAWVEYYKEDVARAVRSGGLVQLHIQELPGGEGVQYGWGRAVPLHFTTRGLYEGAAAFEAEFPGVITRDMTNRGHDPDVFSAAMDKFLELYNFPGVFWTH